MVSARTRSVQSLALYGRPCRHPEPAANPRADGSTLQRPGDYGSPGRCLRVEVPGIEPGSSGALAGLLRAQLTVPLLGPTDHVSESV
jgi:hypothetical protein